MNSIARDFWERWMSQQVVIRFGPFQGRRGQVCGTGWGRVHVVFPETTFRLLGPEQQREWFVADDVERITREELEREERTQMDRLSGGQAPTV